MGYIMGRKPPTPRRACIVCGENSRKLSREHVWADWIKGHIPKDESHHNALSGVVEPDGQLTGVTKKWGGDARNRRLKIVCIACNSGWMSRLQENAKPLLIPLMTGKTKVLSQLDQVLLATWVAMAVMVAEHFEPKFAAFTSADRRHLMDKQRPPQNVRIWMGRYIRGEWEGMWVHRSLRISNEFIPNPADPTLPLPNTQTSTFIVGELYLHVLSCDDDIILNGIQLPTQGVTLFAPIWPVREQAVVWPMDAMSDSQASGFSTAIFDSINRIGVTLAATMRE